MFVETRHALSLKVESKERPASVRRRRSLQSLKEEVIL